MYGNMNVKKVFEKVCLSFESFTLRQLRSRYVIYRLNLSPLSAQM